MTIIEQIKDFVKSQLEDNKRLSKENSIFAACGGEDETILRFLSTLESEKPVPQDLEEAVMNYIAPIENEDGLKVINFSGQDIKDAFVAGAKWQAEQLLKGSPLPEDTVLFNKGVAEGRRLAEEEQADLFTIVALDAAQRAQEQMMKEAVEADVNTYRDLAVGKSWAEFVVEMPTNNLGDKVRIIIVKED